MLPTMLSNSVQGPFSEGVTPEYLQGEFAGGEFFGVPHVYPLTA